MRQVDPIGNADYAYVQAADVIAARIEVGELTHWLPAERDLATELGVSYQTLRHSMKLLRDRGLIITRQGCGTFVTRRQTTMAGKCCWSVNWRFRRAPLGGPMTGTPALG